MDTYKNLENPDAEQTSSHRSGLAVTALVFSLIVCCPITTIIGPILGVISLVRMKSKPHISGKGFAWSAIIVGIIATVLWAIASMFIAKFATEFIEQTKRVSTETIQAGYDADYDTFRSHLSRSSSKVTDSEIKTFIELLQERFGTFDTAFFNMEEQNQEIQSTNQEAPIPIRFIFETKDTTGYIVFEFVPGKNFDYEMQIGCIKIRDSENGDIIFPLDSICAPANDSKKDSDGS